MSQTPNTAIAVIGIDIGKNSFHIVGLDKCGAIVLRQKWSRGQVEARFAHAPQQVASLFGDQSEICLGRSRCDRRHHDVAGFQRLSHADTQRSDTMPKNGRPRCKR